jgi:chromate transport protein ChrA
MAQDSTATRITFYLASIWLVLGMAGIFEHFHHDNVSSLIVAGVLGLVTAGGFITVTWTKKLVVKLVAEPLTMVGVVASAVGFFFHPYAWVTIGIGIAILFAFGCALFEERSSREKAAKIKANTAKLADQPLPF